MCVVGGRVQGELVVCVVGAGCTGRIYFQDDCLMMEGGKGFRSGELGVGRATGLGGQQERKELPRDPDKLFILRARGRRKGERRASGLSRAGKQREPQDPQGSPAE